MTKSLVDRPYALAALALSITLAVIAVRKGTAYLSEHSI